MLCFPETHDGKLLALRDRSDEELTQAFGEMGTWGKEARIGTWGNVARVGTTARLGTFYMLYRNFAVMVRWAVRFYSRRIGKRLHLGEASVAHLFIYQQLLQLVFVCQHGMKGIMDERCPFCRWNMCTSVSGKVTDSITPCGLPV